MLSAAERTDAPQPEMNPDGASPHATRRELLAWSLATSGLFLAGGAWVAFGSTPVGPDEFASRPPFPLETIPRTLDTWKATDETQLDSLTARISGSTEHVIRSYSDELTGTNVSVLILYGPAEPVLPHSPQVCYPASGYRVLGNVADRAIEVAGQRPATFRSALFGKSGGRTVIRHSVYHSYRLDGVWAPDVADRSLPRRWAGLFKVQAWRRVHDGERTGSDEPIESFLRQLLPTLERMIAAAPATAPRQAAPVAP